MTDRRVKIVAAALSEQCRLKAGGECVRYAAVAIAALDAYMDSPEVREQAATAMWALQGTDDDGHIVGHMLRSKYHGPALLSVALRAAREED